MWEIRPARAEEAEELSGLAREIFSTTFGPYNTSSDMELYCSEAFTPAALAAAIADPSTDVIVALEGDRLAAYAQLHRGEAPAAVNGSAPIELMRFYVHGSLHGRGLAQDLMRTVAALSSAMGADTLWLGVWENNPRAISFYRKYGFDVVGDQPFMLGTDLQRDLVMATPIQQLAHALDAATRTGT
jgi:ribosomal protein S18 acetylase RimI-like enzyme